MKKLFLFMTILISMVISIPASAYDFSAVNNDGVTIYYSVTSASDLTVEVSRGDIEYAGEVNIPSTVTYLGKEFSVTSIGREAFAYCRSLTSVTIPNSVTTIGSSAFSRCSGLTSVTIPDSVTSIGEYAFEDCKSLTSVTIPDSVTSIAFEAFEDCKNLNAVHISDLTAWCNIEFENYVSNPLLYAHNLYVNGELLTDLVIPSTFTEIKSNVFIGCNCLTSVTIPNSVTTIGSSAFSRCSGLTSVTIPESVTSIGEYAFDFCSSMTSLVIGNSVTEIGYETFKGCSGLTEVTIPDSVTKIDSHAFEDCSGLTSLVLGEKLESIREKAFYGCDNLKDVWSRNPTPPTCDTDAFKTITCMFATLHVPEGAKAAYQAADVWKEFGVFFEDDAPINVKLNKTDLSLGVGESATLVATLTGGINEDSKVTWTSDNISVATVDDEGLVTAIAEGSAVITATCGDSTATCNVTVIGKCVAPVLSVSDDYAIVAKSETQDAQIHITVNCADAGTYDCTNGQSLDLNGIYNVSAYATADGYSDSDVTTAMLVWVKAYDSTTGIDVLEMKTDRAILLSSVGDKIAVKGCGANEAVIVYDIAGNKLYAGETTTDYFVIPVSLTKGNVYLVTIAGRTIKYLF